MELAETLARAARVFAAQESLAATVRRVAELAVEIVPGIDAAGISLPGGRPGDAVTVGPLAHACETVQRRLGEGPAVDGVPGGEPLLVDLDVDRRWPGFRLRARALGVRGLVVCELPRQRATPAGLTLYARYALEPGTGRVAALYAAHAAVAVSHASQVEHLTTAMETRARVGQAVGLLVQRHRLTADAAFDLLARTSQQVNIKLWKLAEIVVETGVEPGEAADLARRAAKEAGERIDELRQRHTGPGVAGTTRRHVDDAEQRARVAAARAIHRLAQTSARRARAGGDGQGHD